MAAAQEHHAQTLSHEDLLAGLQDPMAYSSAASSALPAAECPADRAVEVRQTHGSLLFFVGERVYKVKKAVDLGFFDFSTLARRKHFCNEELRLNRRLAGEIYLGVLPITRRDDGGLCMGGDGPALEYAVEMVRLPAERMLDRLLAAGEIDNALLRELVEVLARFHRSAAGGGEIASYGSYAAVRELVLGNLHELRAFVGDGVGEVSRLVLAFLTERAEAFLTLHEGLFERRAQRGRVREGHGDLHAGNICCTDEGLVIYDSLEFSAALRCSDVANDLAFLAMDLDHHGFRAFSKYLVQNYARTSGDSALSWLMDFYKGYRALVRAKVAAFVVADENAAPEDRAQGQQNVATYMQLAASYELPPCLVLTCGLPASGKSWLAQRMGQTFDARVLRSDMERKLSAGMAPGDRPEGQAAADLYSAENTDAVYRALSRRAFNTLARGRWAVIDATFAARAQRRRFIDGATRLGHPVVVVEVTCPPEIIRERMVRRSADRGEVSDADQSVYEAMRQQFEPLDELHSSQRVHYASGEDPTAAISAVVERLVIQATAPPPLS